MSVQYTQDIRGCPPAHTGRLWLSVSTHRTFVAVRLCPCVSVGVRQHTQDVCGCPWLSLAVPGCPSAHTRRPWVSVSTYRTSVCPCVSVRKHTRRLWLSINTHISPLVLGVCTLALPVDCLCDNPPRGNYLPRGPQAHSAAAHRPQPLHYDGGSQPQKCMALTGDSLLRITASHQIEMAPVVVIRTGGVKIR
ncbi:hypothetical protein YC2023_066113 [Brassica napus]